MIPAERQVIIEFGAVMVEGTGLDRIDAFQSFARPVRDPAPTEFCTEPTSIRQAVVDMTPPSPAAIRAFKKWSHQYCSSVFCS
jgi:inhibitor of KinA sporulation pathway (predicted exonuclease)